MSVWLVGAGPMATDYARVLKGLRVTFEVIGRGAESAALFEKETGHNVLKGGLTYALSTADASPEQAIIAVGVEQLASTAEELIQAGTKRILIEKPAGLNLAEIQQLNEVATEYSVKVLVGYNRRFYDSVRLARECINEDGGLLSAQFEFTEWSHLIAPLVKAQGVKENWLLANSTHVIDLAFHLIGLPVDWKYWHSGSIDWHPAAARFAGAGVTDRGVLFSYLADWQAPGRWGLELLTKKRRLILRPMEQLQAIPLGTVKIEEVRSLDRLDQDYKPGLYRQTESFLNGDDQFFCSIQEQLENARIYSKLAAYTL